MHKMNFTNKPSELPDAQAELCGLFTEEQLVDFVMGQLPLGKQAKILEHRNQCRICDVMINEWSELLGQAGLGLSPDYASSNAQSQEADVAGAAERSLDCASSNGERHPQGLPHSLSHPPRRLRGRLLLSFRLRSLRKKWSAHRSGYTYGALGGIAVFMLICGLFSLRPQGWVGGDHGQLERDISQQIHLIQSAHTEQFIIEPHPPYYGEGMVWLKRESGEVLIVVDGLHSVVEKDYQIWLEMKNEASSPGILSIPHPQGKSFYHGYGAGEAERLIISLEPKGGSQVQTGPEAVWVDMKR